MLEELFKINTELDKGTDKLLDWYKDHKDDELFKTEGGDMLAKEIVILCKDFARLCMVSSRVEIEQAIKIANFTTP